MATAEMENHSVGSYARKQLGSEESPRGKSALEVRPNLAPDTQRARSGIPSTTRPPKERKQRLVRGRVRKVNKESPTPKRVGGKGSVVRASLRLVIFGIAVLVLRSFALCLLGLQNRWRGRDTFERSAGSAPRRMASPAPGEKTDVEQCAAMAAKAAFRANGEISAGRRHQELAEMGEFQRKDADARTARRNLKIKRLFLQVEGIGVPQPGNYPPPVEQEATPIVFSERRYERLRGRLQAGFTYIAYSLSGIEEEDTNPPQTLLLGEETRERSEEDGLSEPDLHEAARGAAGGSDVLDTDKEEVVVNGSSSGVSHEGGEESAGWGMAGEGGEKAARDGLGTVQRVKGRPGPEGPAVSAPGGSSVPHVAEPAGGGTPLGKGEEAAGGKLGTTRPVECRSGRPKRTSSMRSVVVFLQGLFRESRGERVVKAGAAAEQGGGGRQRSTSTSKRRGAPGGAGVQSGLSANDSKKLSLKREK
ncbi:hypothetical protein CSUI_008918 [Cystoisospora suis]|uniref:Transmembrane protein n=1 Tax=Cystoisospora suis TaxID=483139 RepID=A0A2C6JKH7_9APIC|nr:hypothetical protein CSUI_008918 [Cystoisospora suis]